MRLSAHGTRIGDVEFCATPTGAAAYQRAVDGDQESSRWCLAPYPFVPTLEGVDLDSLAIDLATGFLVACSFEHSRAIAIGEPIRITVDITQVRPRSGSPGAVATMSAELRAGTELVAVHRYVFADGVCITPEAEVEVRP